MKGLKYRLDELGGDWIANPELMFATLPSNMEQLSGTHKIVIEITRSEESYILLILESVETDVYIVMMIQRILQVRIVGTCEDFFEGKLAVLDWQKNAMDVW